MNTIRRHIILSVFITLGACKNVPEAPPASEATKPTQVVESPKPVTQKPASAAEAPAKEDRSIPQFDGKAPKPAKEKVVPGSEAAEAKEYVKLDRLRARFPSLLWYWWQAPDSPALAKEFQPIRQTEGWKTFVRALRVCDDSVNTLLDEDILNWQGADAKISTINRARNAWRRAATHGIKPPKLTEGSTRFDEEGLGFRLFVVDETSGVLVVRTQRGQVLGIFELRLDDAGRQHVVSHMLELALRFPDLYLSYPWDVVMATDTILVPNVDVVVDRVTGEALIRNAATGEVTTKK